VGTSVGIGGRVTLSEGVCWIKDGVVPCIIGTFGWFISGIYDVGGGLVAGNMGAFAMVTGLSGSTGGVVFTGDVGKYGWVGLNGGNVILVFPRGNDGYLKALRIGGISSGGVGGGRGMPLFVNIGGT